MSSSLIVLERAIALHRAFDAAGIAHALGGALALGYHVSEPRGTRDIDVNVSVDVEQADRVFAALPADLPWSLQDELRVREDGQVRLLWPVTDSPAPPIPVDLFLPQHDLHRVVATRTELVSMLDAQVPIICATDLAIFKLLFDRGKDWGDVESMLRFGKVDVPEVQRWLIDIVGPDDQRLGRLADLLRLVQEPAKDVPVAAEIFGRRHSLGD